MTGLGKTSAHLTSRNEHEWHAPVSVDVVVERQFFIRVDGAFGKDTHSYLLPDVPFGDVAVGITAVIRKSTNAPSLGGIDELIQT